MIVYKSQVMYHILLYEFGSGSHQMKDFIAVGIHNLFSVCSLSKRSLIKLAAVIEIRYF